MSDTTQVENDALEWLVLGFVRYALGRESTAVLDAECYVHMYRPALSNDIVRTMAEDIESELRRGQWMPPRYERVWRELAAWLREERG